MYAVKEMFYTLQGEGAQAGRPAVFVRFAGCNLWSGREQDREGAVCSFCDTDFVGTDGVNGGKFESAECLASAALALLARGESSMDTEHTLSKAPPGVMVVFTGGEPLLQLDEAVVRAFQAAGFFTAVETNGTLNAPAGLDWICVSPKAGSEIVQRSGNELKVVFGQDDLKLDAFLGWQFDHFYLQPMDCSDIDQLTGEAIAYCMAHPPWKLSLQTHKILNIP